MGTHRELVLERIDDNRWLIPRDAHPGMRVDGIVYANLDLVAEARSGGGAEQVMNVATLPGIVGASLAMPDIHYGYGFCIGGVAATDVAQGGVISPGGVGYDINCGVRLLSSRIPVDDVLPRLSALVDALFVGIPSGVGVGGPYRFSRKELGRILTQGARFLRERGQASDEELERTESGGCLAGADAQAVSDLALKRGTDQCGTLGSGNHFVEVQRVDTIYDAATAAKFGLHAGTLALMIHSGSRALGHQVCQDHLKLLHRAPEKYGIVLPDRQLACAPVTSPEGERYLAAMRAAANYAWCNRQLLSEQLCDVLEQFFGQGRAGLGLRLVYDVAHNIAKLETHVVDGQERRLCVHRKGATRAFPPGHRELPACYQRTGQPVLVPGDMGRASYVLAGTQGAMEQTFGSTCHGAGRVLSRQEAIRRARGRRIDEELRARGVIARAQSRQGLAEEQPDAYKDVSAVVDCVVAAGISTRVARLVPLGVIKG